MVVSRRRATATPSQKRTAVLWETLNERDANGGYMRFDLGPEWRKLGDAVLEAAVAPNKMNGNFGFFGWFDAAEQILGAHRHHLFELLGAHHADAGQRIDPAFARCAWRPP